MASQDGLVVRGVTKRYGDGVHALRSVNLSVGAGLYGLLGPNGAGKSSLMRTLATLQVPDEGSITLDGVDVLADPQHLRARLGYLPQQLGAYPGASALDLLDRFAWLKGITERRQRRAQIALLLEKVNLSAAAQRPVATYSGGMLRRFGIAVALLGSPRLLIVDEPTAGLDPAERNRFHRVLADVAADAVVLLSTHIVEDVENLCARLAVLCNGQIVAEGTPAALAAPWQGKLWQAEFHRGEPVPEALRSYATPTGTRVVVEAASSPGERYALHAPRLEDVYYMALPREDLAA